MQLSGNIKSGNSVIVQQKDRDRKSFKKQCKSLCKFDWSQMRLRTQIILKLVLIIFLLFAIYMVVLAIIFEFYYKPDVLKHFREELTSVHAWRTSNMTVSISTRFEAFDELTFDNVGKMQKLLKTTQVDGYDPLRDLPFNYQRQLYPDYCTNGVSEEHQYLVRNFEPLFINLLKLKLGWQTNLEIYSIFVLFKGEGICAFHNDPEVQMARMALLNQLGSSDFDHRVFSNPQANQHISKETGLFNDAKEMFGTWAVVQPYENREPKIAISLQYDLADLGKLMPHFVDQLQVPLIAIFDSKTRENYYFKDSSPNAHFANNWGLSERGFCLGETESKFTTMEFHEQLHEQFYRARDELPGRDRSEEEEERMRDLPQYHLVQTCIPLNVPLSACETEGQMVLVIGQEAYEDSPFTKEIESIMKHDVDNYYGIIVMIFIIVKIVLFFVLWSWLRIRVTERMIGLTNKLKTNDQAEKRNFSPQKFHLQDVRKNSFRFDSNSNVSYHTNPFDTTRSSLVKSPVNEHRKSSANASSTTKKNLIVDVVDKLLPQETKRESIKASSRQNKKNKKGKQKDKKTKVTINEIDALQDAMDLLFGEQQEQSNSNDRVKFKAQEQSLNPCYYQNQNSQHLKPGENFYFFQLNEMCEFQEFNEKPKTHLELREKEFTPFKVSESNPFDKNKAKFGASFGATHSNLLQTTSSIGSDENPKIKKMGKSERTLYKTVEAKTVKDLQKICGSFKSSKNDAISSKMSEKQAQQQSVFRPPVQVEDQQEHQPSGASDSSFESDSSSPYSLDGEHHQPVNPDKGTDANQAQGIMDESDQSSDFDDEDNVPSEIHKSLHLPEPRPENESHPSKHSRQSSDSSNADGNADMVRKFGVKDNTLVKQSESIQKPDFVLNDTVEAPPSTVRPSESNKQI